MESDRKEALPGLTAADLDAISTLHATVFGNVEQHLPWWCDECGCEVFARDVTNCERHDERAEGCGERVIPYEARARRVMAESVLDRLPSLLALARRGLEAEAQYERGYEQGIKERVAEVVRTERERDVLYDATRLSVIGMEVVRSAARMASDKDARVLLKANIETSDKLAAALAEVERVRGRLEKATYFSWRNSAVWIVRPEDSTLWHAYEEVGSCGAALIGKFDTLDAAWSAAEAQAGQAAKQGGEGRT